MAARPTTTRPAVLLMFQLTHCARQVFCQSDLLLERVHTLGQCIDLGVLLLEHVDLLFGWKNQCQTGANFGAKNSAKRRYRPMCPVALLYAGKPLRPFTSDPRAWRRGCGNSGRSSGARSKADGLLGAKDLQRSNGFLWLFCGRSTRREGSLGGSST